MSEDFSSMELQLLEIENNYKQLEMLWNSNHYMRFKHYPITFTLALINLVKNEYFVDLEKFALNKMKIQLLMEDWRKNYEILITGYYECLEELDLAGSSISVPKISPKMIGFSKTLIIINSIFKEFIGFFSHFWSGVVISLGKKDFVLLPDYQILIVPSFIKSIRTNTLRIFTIVGHEAAHFILNSIQFGRVDCFSNPTRCLNTETNFIGFPFELCKHLRNIIDKYHDQINKGKQFFREELIQNNLESFKEKFFDEIMVDTFSGIIAGPKYFIDLYDYLIESSNDYHNYKTKFVQIIFNLDESFTRWINLLIKAKKDFGIIRSNFLIDISRHMISVSQNITDICNMLSYVDFQSGNKAILTSIVMSLDNIKENLIEEYILFLENIDLEKRYISLDVLLDKLNNLQEDFHKAITIILPYPQKYIPKLLRFKIGIYLSKILAERGIWDENSIKMLNDKQEKIYNEKFNHLLYNEDIEKFFVTKKYKNIVHTLTDIARILNCNYKLNNKNCNSTILSSLLYEPSVSDAELLKELIRYKEIETNIDPKLKKEGISLLCLNCNYFDDICLFNHEE